MGLVEYGFSICADGLEETCVQETVAVQLVAQRTIAYLFCGNLGDTAAFLVVVVSIQVIAVDEGTIAGVAAHCSAVGVAGNEATYEGHVLHGDTFASPTDDTCIGVCSTCFQCTCCQHALQIATAVGNTTDGTCSGVTAVGSGYLHAADYVLYATTQVTCHGTGIALLVVDATVQIDILQGAIQGDKHTCCILVGTDVEGQGMSLSIERTTVFLEHGAVILSLHVGCQTQVDSLVLALVDEIYHPLVLSSTGNVVVAVSLGLHVAFLSFPTLGAETIYVLVVGTVLSRSIVGIGAFAQHLAVATHLCGGIYPLVSIEGYGELILAQVLVEADFLLVAIQHEADLTALYLLACDGSRTAHGVVRHQHVVVLDVVAVLECTSHLFATDDVTVVLLSVDLVCERQTVQESGNG